jgi:hypothetical protein
VKRSSPKFVALIWLAVVTAGALPAADTERPSPESVRQAMSDADFPWYDSQTDRIRIAPAVEEPALRGSGQWQWSAARPRTPSSRWRLFWEFVWQAVQYGVWVGLAVLFAVLAYLWIRRLARHELQPYDQSQGEQQRQREAASIDQLPFPVTPPQTDLLGEARRLYQANRFDEAIVYLFSYELVQLDRRQFIELAKGKTNRQYLAELRDEPFLREELTRTMLAFEDAFFGRHRLSRERFEACWSRVDAFDQYLQSPATGQREVVQTS